MRINQKIRPTKIALGVSAALAFNPGITNAQDQGIEEVVVVGQFRNSIISSIGTKRDNASIVEVVSAEDIGKLPDSSIAESIARLPGLTAQRLDGRASRVSIRGFGEDEGATTFNGREQVSIGDNRGVEFDLYPSEIMSGVLVYKTPDATLDAEGIAGVIDMRTVEPLKADASMKLNIQYEKSDLSKVNPDGNDDGLRGSFSYIDQFADDNIGIALAVTTMDSPSQENRWNAWGYPEFTVDGQDFSALGGAKPFVRSSTLNRDSAMLIVEAQASENLNITADALYVDFSDQKILRGIEIPFAWGQGSLQPGSAVVDPNTGFITSATTVGQRVVVRNDYEERNAEMSSFGINFDYHVSDTFSLEFDASHSEVERDIYSLESYSGTGRGDNQGVPDTITYTLAPGAAGATFSGGLDYSDPDLIRLGGPLTWGWQSSLNERFGIVGTDLENTAQDGFLNTPQIDDQLTSLKLVAENELNMGIIDTVSYGVSYRDREKTKLSQGFFLTSSQFPEMVRVPDAYNLGSISLDFLGIGDMIAYDSLGLVRDGFYFLTEETGANHTTKSWTVEEQVTSFFAQADLSTELGAMPLTGNVGLRYVQTDQSSLGNAIDGADVVSNRVDHDYANLLPSLNLTLGLSDNQNVRFGAAKTISRPRMDEMNSSYNISYNLVPDVNGNYLRTEGGNPVLEAKEAVGYDLTYENYFSPEGYFSVALFYKDLKNWIFDGVDQVDVSDYLTASGLVTPDGSTTATVNGKVNGGGGSIKGYEISFAFPFNVISERLDGFGVLTSYTHVSSNIEDPDGNDFKIPGLSENISSITAYYENHGLQFRVSARKRDDFKGEVFGLGFNTVQVDVKGETVVDAQIGYDFGEAGYEKLEGLSVYLQGQNLSDEPFTSTQGDDLKIRDYQQYGKTYLLGVSYEF